jgi:hypothetical protein
MGEAETPVPCPSATPMEQGYTVVPLFLDGLGLLGHSQSLMPMLSSIIVEVVSEALSKPVCEAPNEDKGVVAVLKLCPASI